MGFQIISIALIIFVIGFILNTIMRVFRPSYQKVEKRIKPGWLSRASLRWETRIFRLRHRIYRTMIGFVSLSKAKEREYKRYIDRLNLKWDNEPLNPKMIVIDQFSMFLLFIIISGVTYLFVPVAGIGLLVLSPIGYRLPIIDLKEKLEKIDAIISREFNSFYSVVYYQFRKQNKMLSSVVKEYIPNASPEMVFELKIFLENLKRGEEYALVELRRRLPLKYVIRFCDVMKVRVVGIENISQMTYLKEEMHEEERHRIKKALDKRKKQAIAMQAAVYLLLLQFIIVYWYLQLYNVKDIMIK